MHFYRSLNIRTQSVLPIRPRACSPFSIPCVAAVMTPEVSLHLHWRPGTEVAGFLAVVNFDEGSSQYAVDREADDAGGQCGPGMSFHHIGMSADGTTVACGGLLSVLKGSGPDFLLRRVGIRATEVPLVGKPAALCDHGDFQSLPQGGFLVTMMGGARGTHPEEWRSSTGNSSS